jgi:hypothetical protein
MKIIICYESSIAVMRPQISNAVMGRKKLNNDVNYSLGGKFSNKVSKI